VRWAYRDLAAVRQIDDRIEDDLITRLDAVVHLNFRAEVTRDVEADAYVDMSAWRKGYLWVNGHLLGRYWNLGPQQRLYCPAPWWRKGANEILVLDFHHAHGAPIRGAVSLHG